MKGFGDPDLPLKDLGSDKHMSKSLDFANSLAGKKKSEKKGWSIF